MGCGSSKNSVADSQKRVSTIGSSKRNNAVSNSMIEGSVNSQMDNFSDKPNIEDDEMLFNDDIDDHSYDSFDKPIHKATLNDFNMLESEREANKKGSLVVQEVTERV